MAKKEKNAVVGFAIIAVVFLIVVNLAILTIYNSNQQVEETITGAIIQNFDVDDVDDVERAPQTFTVLSKRLGFNPIEIVIKKGDTVIWENDGVSDFDIIISFGIPKVLESGRIFPGESYTYTFEESGEFEYLSVVTEAKGRIVVE